MNQTEIIHMMQQIENYILGKLSQPEIDQLWMEFLKNPEWLRVCETELHIRSMARRGEYN